QRITEFAALVNRAGRLRGDVARDSAGKRKLLEEPFHPDFVPRDARVDFAVRAFEPGVRDQPRTAMAWPSDVNHIEPELLDDPVTVGVNEIKSGSRAPMAEQSRLDMLEPQRLFQQRIVVEIDLADGEVIRGAPPCVDEAQLLA